MWSCQLCKQTKSPPGDHSNEQERWQLSLLTSPSRKKVYLPNVLYFDLNIILADLCYYLGSVRNLQQNTGNKKCCRSIHCFQGRDLRHKKFIAAFLYLSLLLRTPPGCKNNPRFDVRFLQVLQFTLCGRFRLNAVKSHRVSDRHVLDSVIEFPHKTFFSFQSAADKLRFDLS